MKKYENILNKTQISANELIELLEARKNNLIDFELIDIREPFEYKNIRIKGVDKLLSVTNFQNDLQNWNNLLQNKKCVIYCRSGNRTSQLQKFFKYQFNKDIPHLSEGIINYHGDVERDK